jgi:hypothetical protein
MEGRAGLRARLLSPHFDSEGSEEKDRFTLVVQDGAPPHSSRHEAHGWHQGEKRIRHMPQTLKQGDSRWEC